MRKTIWIATMGLLCLNFSCMEPKEIGQGQELSKVYFDVKGLLSEQEELLVSAKPTVKKNTLIGEKEEAVASSDLSWKKELKLFAQLDINKPVLLRSYSIDTLASGNDRKLVYKALNEDLKVRELEVVIDNGGNPKNIKAAVREENPIYMSERFLTMDLSNGKISSYGLKGYQKVKTQDTTTYQMNGVIMW